MYFLAPPKKKLDTTIAVRIMTIEIIIGITRISHRIDFLLIKLVAILILVLESHKTSNDFSFFIFNTIKDMIFIVFSNINFDYF